MPFWRHPVLLLAVAGLVPAFVRAGDPVSTADEQFLKAAGIATTAPDLLEFFRRRGRDRLDRDALQALAARLADPSAEVRDRTAAELTAYGPPAVPFLRQAANELADPEAAARARRCLEQIESGSAALTAAAARALAALNPPGTAEVLLAYLPRAEEDATLDEITAALAFASRGSPPAPAMLKALTDPAPVRRAVAADVLAQSGGTAGREAVRPLLKDPRPAVRLRAALALARQHEAEAVPILVDLLAELPAEAARPVEDFLVGLAGEWALAGPPGADRVSRRLRRDLWAAWWTATDGPTLLEEFKAATPSDADRRALQGLVAQLGAPVVAEREKAVAELLARGPAAAPVLRRAAADRDAGPPGTAEAARRCLALLDPSARPPLPPAAARLLALRRPQGADEALLAFLPSAEDETTAAEVRAALAAVGIRDGAAAEPLVKALADPEPIRRAAAAEALAADGNADARAAVRPLLKDPDGTVRLRAALALAGRGEREAVPELIALLTSPALAGTAEEALRLLAGDAAPEAVPGEDDAARRKARAAWDAWWEKHGSTVDLARLDRRRRSLGYTLVVEPYDPARRTGRVVEFDRRGRVRWQIEGLMGPSDAQVLPGDRVLVCEHNANRVTERDLKGKILWERAHNQPVAAQRLPGGNTFLVGRGQVIELDRAGKEVFSHVRPAFDIICGRKERNGQVTLVTNQGVCLRLDAAGKELRSLRVPPIQVYNGYADVLSNDHVVVPLHGSNKVVEYDAQGKSVWEAEITLPMSARRLDTGNTLVTSSNPPRVVELDRAGKVVWENKDAVRPVRADRR